MKWMVAKMTALGVLSQERYKVAFMLDGRAMLTVHTQKHGAPRPTVVTTKDLIRRRCAPSFCSRTSQVWQLVQIIPGAQQFDDFWNCA